ncbi:hypothetical protein CA13_09240 [Planctomycetes bacterium CA13]|uniref:Uncharacterized protein n=1 Tax=Novipirellula herctigrandis TaxID=2527986 RepID=A0A5C5YXB6_9BACT|nr:hypothetical protein CA13_09240 [Planctomycetes bacterium CA13]
MTSLYACLSSVLAASEPILRARVKPLKLRHALPLELTLPFLRATLCCLVLFGTSLFRCFHSHIEPNPRLAKFAFGLSFGAIT